MNADNPALAMDREYYDFFKQRVSSLLNFWFKIDAQGLDCIPKHGPVLIIAKHSHMIDPLIVGAVIDRYAYAVSKDDNLKIPWLGPRLERIGMYPIDRDYMTRKNFTDLMSLLEQGEAVGYAPEMSRFFEAVAKLHLELTFHARQWQNRKGWKGDEITHAVIGIEYASTPWWRPRAEINVRAKSFDVARYETLDDLAEGAGQRMAVLSGLEYLPEEYDYYLKYADSLALKN